LSPDFGGQHRLTQVAQTFALGQHGLFEQASDAALPPVFGLAFADVLQELAVSAWRLELVIPSKTAPEWFDLGTAKHGREASPRPRFQH